MEDIDHSHDFRLMGVLLRVSRGGYVNGLAAIGTRLVDVEFCVQPVVEELLRVALGRIAILVVSHEELALQRAAHISLKHGLPLRDITG